MLLSKILTAPCMPFAINPTGCVSSTMNLNIRAPGISHLHATADRNKIVHVLAKLFMCINRKRITMETNLFKTWANTMHTRSHNHFAIRENFNYLVIYIYR